MKGEIKAFLLGFCGALCCLVSYLFGRKKNLSDGGGIHGYRKPASDSFETIGRIQERTESGLSEVESGLSGAIAILQGARERSEKEDNAM